MKYFIFIFLVVFCSLSYAQDNNIVTDTIPIQKEQIIITNKNKVVTDTVVVGSTKPIIIQTELTPITQTYINEDLSILSDDLWFSELENSSLNINNEISNTFYDESELSTEVIKQRLAYLNSKTPFNV